MQDPRFILEEAYPASDHRIDLDRADLLTKRRRLDRLLRWFRSCAVCGTSLPPIDLLCADCWETFDRVRNRAGWLEQPGYPFKVYSLLTWTEENAHFVKPFIYALKGGYAVAALEKLSQVLTFERRWANRRPPVFLHPPSSSKLADHAMIFSAIMEEYWQAYAYRLERAADDEGGSQKKRDVASRSLRKFETVLGPARFADLGVPHVFVDDVITSGATAKAARAAIGDPDGFEAWTLVCRPKLAAPSAF